MAGTVAKTDIPMFLAKLWNLVDDPNTDALIKWSSGGTSFIVQDPGNFAKVLLPQYFKHRNMASFIRVLNMYGFRKVIKLDSGSLRSLRDEMEFQHPCFLRGNEQLLIHIKRKPPATPTSSQIGQSNNKALSDGVNQSINQSMNQSLPALANKESEKEINKVLNDVRLMRNKQETMDVRLNDMKRENECMWAELQELRSKHAHQQIVVNKLIEFFITLLHNTGNVAPGAQIRAPLPQLAIQTSLEGPALPKRPRHENGTGGTGGTGGDGSPPEGYRGPIIRDVTDAWSAAYPQQPPEVVDWDRLLNLNDGSGAGHQQQQQVLDGLRSRPGPPLTQPQTQTPIQTQPPSPIQTQTQTQAQTQAQPQAQPQAQTQAQTQMAPLRAKEIPALAPGSQIISVVPMVDGGVSGSLMQGRESGRSPAASPIGGQGVQGGQGSPMNYTGQGGVQLPNGQNLDGRNEAGNGARMEQQVDTIQSNLDYIRDLLQNPNYNLDLSQIYQLFPDVAAAHSLVQPSPTPNQTNKQSSNDWSHNNQNALVEFQQQQEHQNHEDNALLSTEDNDDFMTVFNSLPADDDLIEGVTIQIPEYPNNNSINSINSINPINTNSSINPINTNSSINPINTNSSINSINGSSALIPLTLQGSQRKQPVPSSQTAALSASLANSQKRKRKTAAQPTSSLF